MFPILIVLCYLMSLQIKCCLDEWNTGMFASIPFTASEYKESFSDVLAMLTQFDRDI
jgi:hypothetical protein